MKDVIEPVGFRQFEFALTTALVSQLVTVLDGMDAAALLPKTAFNIPNGQGVYQLFLGDELVYIGKTDNDAGLQRRLLRHAKLAESRGSLANGAVKFKAVQVLVFSAMELETMLMRHYREQGAALAWNNSGFGSNDPGHNREGSNYKEGHFDLLYPITIDTQLNISLLAGQSIFDALKILKSDLPYLLRFGGMRKKDLEYEDLNNHILPSDLLGLSLRETLIRIVACLPKGFIATKFPGYVILYKEPETYEYGEIIAKS